MYQYIYAKIDLWYFIMKVQTFLRLVVIFIYFFKIQF